MDKILARLYVRANIITMICLVSLCCFFNWPEEMMMLAAILSLVLSSPGVLTVHAIVWVSKRLSISTGFAWIMLLAALPLAVSIPAFVFEETLPGNEVFLIILGMVTSYTVVFSQGTAISEIFKSINGHE